MGLAPHSMGSCFAGGQATDGGPWPSVPRLGTGRNDGKHVCRYAKSKPAAPTATTAPTTETPMIKPACSCEGGGDAGVTLSVGDAVGEDDAARLDDATGAFDGGAS